MCLSVLQQTLECGLKAMLCNHLLGKRLDEKCVCYERPIKKDVKFWSLSPLSQLCDLAHLNFWKVGLERAVTRQENCRVGMRVWRCSEILRISHACSCHYIFFSVVLQLREFSGFLNWFSVWLDDKWWLIVSLIVAGDHLSGDPRTHWFACLCAQRRLLGYPEE